ncbi:hypothetical protein [Aquabacterium sp.]|uniref:hypothetical protein n=1 Tax=Aquabacterium sp. TaxID=1872578 RepID=UPI00378393B8
MLKLYRLDGPHKAYWQTWQDTSGEHIVHWGALGTLGDSKSFHPLHPNRDPLALQAEIDAQRAAGFVEIDVDAMDRLRVQGRPAPGAAPLAAEPLQRTLHELDRRLGDTGLGQCETGPGSAIAAASDGDAWTFHCRVVDGALARSCITQALKAWFGGGLSIEPVDDDGRVLAG